MQMVILVKKNGVKWKYWYKNTNIKTVHENGKVTTNLTLFDMLKETVKIWVKVDYKNTLREVWIFPVPYKVICKYEFVQAYIK